MTSHHSLVFAVLAGVSLSTSAEEVSFNKDIRPILADRCFSCHGPDSASRKANLRLDLEKDAKTALSGGGSPIVAGKPDSSAIIHRLTHEDPEELMPPPESKLTVSPGEIELIRRWIAQGARWERHWAFLPPGSAPPASPPEHPWPLNAIDQYVLETLSKHELKPSPPADRAQLLRRVTFDLTGLPPTIEELDSFLFDNSDQAYHRVVDRLLTSPAFGERMALEWLDVARYGDTDGLFEDHPRSIHAWRDWVVQAFNDNLPYKDFITWQLAGDLLPSASNAQKVATGFLRNNPTSNEGGIIDEDYRIKYLVDRVNTTSTAFLGLTMECAQCHDHKFDPMTQREYYELAGFFNSLVGRGNTKGATAPTLRLLSTAQEERLAAINTELRAIEKTLQGSPARLTADFEKWNTEIEDPVTWTTPRVISSNLADISANNAQAPPPEQSGVRGRFIRIALNPGSSGFLTISEVEVYSGGRNVARAGKASQSSDYGGNNLASRAIAGTPDGSFGSCSCTKEEADAWWEVDLGTEFPIDHILIYNRNDCCPERLDNVSVTVLDAARKKTRGEKIGDAPFKSLITLNPGAPAPAPSPEEKRYELVLDPSSLPGALTALRVTGERAGLIEKLQAHVVGGDRQELKLQGADKIVVGPAKDPHIVGLTTPASFESGHTLKLTITGRTPLDIEFTTVATAFVRTTLPAQRDKRLTHFRATWPGFGGARKTRDTLNSEKGQIEKSGVLTMIAGDEGTSRKTHVLMRGEYDKPGENVEPSAPGSILPFPQEFPRTRLGLARWMTAPDNPLTARVAVNRYWQMLFGAGIVITSEDFGTQGDRPSHQALLDHLAVEFMNSGWDVKALLRQIVTSATYRQSSVRRARLAELDPENRLLARAPRQRLQAEFIRDHALAVGGLLVNKRGGPGVHPYQPAELFGRNAIGSAGASFKQGSGEDLYRRSLYTYWKRQIPAANMRILGADGRTACRTRRERTNTPLQALVLLNDPQFVEAARALAERALREGGDDMRERIAYAFRLATSRHPGRAELGILHAEFKDRLKGFTADPERARDYLHGGGERKPDPGLNQAELAAFAAVASLILNLDESISRS